MANQGILDSLKLIFGEIPPLIWENTKYLIYDEECNHFSCFRCDKIIQISPTTESTRNNFKKHLTSNYHKSCTTSIINLSRSIQITFGGATSSIILNNQNYLDVVGANYECVICKKTITVSSNKQVTENNFLYHLISNGHEEKLQDFQNIIIKLCDVFGGITDTILNNSQFLMRQGKHYMCTLCGKQLKVHPTEVEFTEQNFENHFHSLAHKRKAKEAKAFSVIPGLNTIFSTLPNYMLQNVEYISINGPNFFCSLCNVNIKCNQENPKNTKLNFKLHIMSSYHEEKLENRRDPSNLVISALGIFDALPDAVRNNVKYLTMNGDYFFCQVCEEDFFIFDDLDETLVNLQVHMCSYKHTHSIESKKSSSLEVSESLDNLFGATPEIIQDNLKYIKHERGVDFNCEPCNKILKAKFNNDNDDSVDITESNFEKHLNSKGHINVIERLEDVQNGIRECLLQLFGLLPQLVNNNIDHISFNNETDNYECYLCNKDIAVVPGNKKGELTKLNFQNHLLSAEHVAKLKQEANIAMKTAEKLDSIFGCTPDFILSNIEHLQYHVSYYFCILCEVKIIEGNSISTERNFHNHLFGAQHMSNLENIENGNNEAFNVLDYKYWRIPEFILQNIDFLSTFGVDDDDHNDLFCILCQEKLTINDDDLEKTKRDLRGHIDSEEHQLSLKND